MNVKKVITAALAVFLLCAVFCGAVSAFEVMQSGKTDPSGSLVPNEKVTGYMQIKIPAGTLDMGDTVKFESDLLGATWTISASSYTSKGESVPRFQNKVLQYPYNSLTGFDICYETTDTVMDIYVTGTVPASSAGSTIRAMTVRSAVYETTGVGVASSPAQSVYNVNNLASDIAATGSEIQGMDSRINVYISYGWDVSKAQSKLEQARAKQREAGSISDPRSAYVTLDTARNLLNEAKRELALSSFSLSLSYTTYTSNIVDKLYAKGWNSEGMLLDTKNTNLVNTYNQLYATFTAGNIPDAAALDKLAADSMALYADALVYEESADNPLGGLLNYLPFILIGLGAAAIIVVVVVVIVKKRKNSWDELG